MRQNLINEDQKNLASYKEALRDAEKKADKRGIAKALHDLAAIYQEQGDYKEAIRLYNESLNIRTKSRDKSGMAIILSNLGGIYKELGDFEKAKKFYGNALEIDEKALGPDHPTVARDINNLGSILQDLGDLENAKKNFQRALEIDERAFGQDHPNVAIRLNNLGSVLHGLGDLEGAKKYLERALEIDEKALGPDHPSVATDINNLGSILYDMCDLNGAREYFERALEIDEKIYGPDHPTIAIRLNNLGSILNHQGDHKTDLKYTNSIWAWQYLHHLTQDRDSRVREKAAYALGLAFAYVPDKSQAWWDIHRLTQDGDSRVREKAAYALGPAFSQIPDKSLAWQDLHRLIQDEDRIVRGRAADAIGEAFGLIPDKSKAWQDLHGLTQDEDRSVRMLAYYSLGRASGFKATTADDKNKLEEELGAAIKYFEKSSQESAYSPARFCSPFYRSYFAIIFQDAKEEEIQKYLAEAREAVGISKCKDELLKAVENLAQALQKAQRLMDRPFEEVASELNTYRWYCNKAASHMDAAEDKAPIETKLMKMCNPLLEERMQATIAEIQEKAKQICQITHGSGTDYEAPGAEIQKAARALSADDLVSIQKNSLRIILQLKRLCRLLPVEDRKLVCDIVEGIGTEPEFPIKLNKIYNVLSYLAPIVEDKSPCLADVVILTVLPEEYGSILGRLSELGPPPDIGSAINLYAWQFGKVFCQKFKTDYKIAVGLIGRPGTTQAALAVREAMLLWRPRYIFFSGIAGGLSNPKEDDALPGHGDVVVADVIYGYEYGKIDKEFPVRTNLTYRTDKALLTGAKAYSRSDGWRRSINAKPPVKCNLKVISGEIASSDKLIDNPSNSFFKQILKMWPKIIAVEMEGAGVAGAIEQAQSLGIPTGFMMIRGISDLPRAEGKDRGTKERDAWKIYASDVAAAFIIGWISDGLPVRPSARIIQ